MLKRLDITSIVILLTLACAGVGLVLHPGQGYPWNSYFDDWFYQILRFSVLQAFFSALGAVVIAAPFAILLAWQPFQGEWFLKSLLNLFFIMPVLTIVLAVVASFSEWINVFSLQGILLAHWLINVPYAIRLLWERQSQVSLQNQQLAATLGFGVWQTLRWVRLPVLWQSVRPIFIVIFLLCFSSFTIVLTLSGGPANTNLELAIYQALKFDFDPKAAVFYAGFHGLIAFSLISMMGKRGSYSLEFSKQSGNAKPMLLAQMLASVVLLIVLFYPLLMLFRSSFSTPFVVPSRLAEAMQTSLLLATGSGVLATLLAVFRSLHSTETRLTRMLDFGLLVLPTMVITTGLFLLSLRFGIAFKITHGLIIWLNGLMAMPLILSPLKARVEVYRAQYSRLIAVLNMTPWQSFRFIYWPAIRSILPWAVSLSMVLSVGDLGVAVLLGSAQFVTLPILIFQAMGSYQMLLASQLTLLLLAICVALLLLAEWLGGRTHAKG